MALLHLGNKLFLAQVTSAGCMSQGTTATADNLDPGSECSDPGCHFTDLHGELARVLLLSDVRAANAGLLNNGATHDLVQVHQLSP